MQMGGKPLRDTLPLGSFAHEGLREALVMGEDGQPKLATVVRAGPNAQGTTYYTPEFLKLCLAEGRFTGSLMRLNHPSVSEAQDRPEGDLGRVVGRTGDAFWDEADRAIKAPLVLLGDDTPGTPAHFVRTVFADQAVADQAGLSIHYPHRVEWGEAIKDPKTGRAMRHPVSLPEPGKMYVDFVLAPAAGGRVPLLAGQREESDPVEIATLTLEELQAENPALVEAIRATAAPPAQPQTTPDPAPIDITGQLREAIAPLIAQNQTLADTVQALQTRLDQQDGTNAVQMLIREAGLKEAEAALVAAELTGRPFDTSEALKSAFDASVSRVDQLLESVGAPAVRDNGAALPPEGQGEEPSALDILRESGQLPATAKGGE
jgi:hypothetical protein